MLDFLFDLIGSIVGEGLTSRLVRRRRDRYARDSKVECALRVLSGSQSGLTSRWRHGVARIRRGAIDFDGSPILVANIADGFRKPRFKDLWTNKADVVMVRVTTGSAELEWAVPEHQLTWVRAAIGGG